jgi:hypothetical protein
VIARFAQGLLALLVAVDAVVCAVWLALLYTASERWADKPTGRQTISGYIGGAALHGHAWARLPERLIDALFGEGHCLRSYQRGQG